MGKIVVIVESAGKIKSIQSYLGNKYVVVASCGHIMDLDPKKLSIEIENDFKPIYKTMDGKGKIINNLKSLAKDAPSIMLATDKDREGEMIAWSIANVLKIKRGQEKRIIFTSITKDSIQKAVSNPDTMNYNMIDAQKVRRMLDRIVGFYLCPILWKCMPGCKSAGRVQSVVVRILVDREAEINQFFDNDDGRSFFKVTGLFEENIKAKLMMREKKKVPSVVACMETKNDAKKLLNKCSKSTFIIFDISCAPSIRNPQPPFTTFTLQQEASRRIGFGSKKTMSVAQKLYERGFITYMRTDSVNICDEALNKIKKYIEQTYGNNYYRRKEYKAKSANTQEAHEAVRPTKVEVLDPKMGNDEAKLYRLIWRRTIASQMKPAEYNITTIQILASELKKYIFVSTFEELVFDGYLLVYGKSDNEEDGEDTRDNNKKPTCKVGDELIASEIVATEEFKKPPTRYNESSLINKMDPKNLNIGRPSTTATVIGTIQDREYVTKGDVEGVERDAQILKWKNDGTDRGIATKNVKIKIGEERNKLLPTELGINLVEFLVEHFPKVMDYKFTADIEKELDGVAEGTKNWLDVMKEFYEEFNPLVEDLLSKSKDVVAQIEDKNLRILGTDPVSGKEISATSAKYGPVARRKEGEKYTYAPIKKPHTLKNITLEIALQLLEYPRLIGKYGKKYVYVKKGKYGFYLVVGKDNFSLTDTGIEDDGGNITIEEATIIIEKQLKKQEGKVFKSDTNIYTIRDGPYGEYINVQHLKNSKKKAINISLDKDIDSKNLTLDLIEAIVMKNNGKKKYKNYKKKGNSKPNKN